MSGHDILTLEVPLSEATPVAGRIASSFGCATVQLERPNHERAWLELYFDEPGRAEIIAAAVHAWPEVIATAIRRETPRDWQTFWRHHFHAVNIGQHLRIVPVWAPEPPAHAGDRAIIHLDPGLSFGTGDHFTTRFCLEMIDRLVPAGDVSSMLDVGTGSSILAIAAGKLGVARILAIDHDAIALEQARENLRLNGLEGSVELRVGDVMKERTEGSFDLVCANVYTTVLLSIAPALVAGTRKYLVLSGIRDPELDQVAHAYAAAGLDEIFRDGNGEWGGLAFRKGPS